MNDNLYICIIYVNQVHNLCNRSVEERGVGVVGMECGYEVTDLTIT